MKVSLSGRALFGILFIVAALVGTPIAVYQLQQQQTGNQSRAWYTSQSATTSCPTYGSYSYTTSGTTGIIITVKFSNTESNISRNSMTVVAKDRQTGKSVNLGAIAGGQTKTAVIETGRTTLSAGTVDFSLKWTDGHYGTDTKSSSYNAVIYCNQPTPTPPYSTPKPSQAYPSPSQAYLTPTPTVPYGVTPTACPTLGPVKNVKIDCPNCPKY